MVDVEKPEGTKYLGSTRGSLARMIHEGIGISGTLA